MRGTLAYMSLVLLNATLVRMAPATPGAGIDSGTALIQMAGKVPSVPSDASSNFCRKGGHSQLSAGEVVVDHFSIRGSTVGLTICYCTGLPMDRELIKDTMITAWNHLNEQYRIYGDTPLRPDEDPYIVPVPQGKNSKMFIESLKIPGTETIPTHVTYSLALTALSGLFDYCYTYGHAGAVVAHIFDPTRSSGAIGIIAFSPKYDEQ